MSYSDAIARGLKRKRELEKDTITVTGGGSFAEAIERGLRRKAEDEWLRASDIEFDDDFAPTVNTIVEEPEEELKWYEKGLFADGYDFGDITKTILGIEDKKTVKTFQAPETTETLEELKKKQEYYSGRTWNNSEQLAESLKATQQYNQMALAQYSDKLSKTKMPGKSHSVLEEIEILANMKSGEEKDARKDAVLKKMESLGMDSSFYSHFAGDGEFDWGTFGQWLKNASMAGLNSFNKGLLDTADVLLGAPLKEMGWEDNPISKGAEYYNTLYSNYRYNADLLAEKMGGGAWNFGSDAVEGTLGAVPNALLLFMTGGASTATSTSNLMNQAAMSTGNILTKAGLTTQSMMKNPQFWTSFARTLGSDYKEAKEQGASDAAAAVGSILTSLMNAGIEIGPDGGSGIQGLPDGLKGGKPLWEWAESSLEEGGEEMLQKFVGEAIAKVGYGSDQEMLNPIEYAKEGILGTISGAVLGGGQTAVQSGVNAYNEHQADKLTKGEQAVADKITEKRIAEKEKSGKLTAKEKSDIKQEVERNLRKGYLTAEEIEEAIGGEAYEIFRAEKDNFFGSDNFKNYQKAVKEETEAKKEFESLVKLKQGEMTGEQIYRRDDLKKFLEESKVGEMKATLDKDAQRVIGLRNQMRSQMMQTVKGTRLEETYRELERKQQKFQVDVNQYQNENARKTVESILASGLGDNSNQFHETVDWLAKLSEERNVTFDLTKTERLKGTKHYKEGYVTNGFKTTVDGKTTITLNMDGHYLNSTVGHEITHVLEQAGVYKELATAVKNFAIAKEGQEAYDARLNAIKEIYGDDQATIDSELTADIIGEYLFTDYNFVQSLSTKNRNVFQRIYDEIKYMVKIATAGSKEARELEKVKKMFDKAWKDTNGKQEVSKEYEQATPEEQEFSDYLIDDKIYSEQDRLAMDVLDTKSIQYSYSAIPSHKKSLEKNYDFENASLDLETINQRYDKIISTWEKLGGELDSKFLNDWNNKVERPFTIFKAQSGYKYNVELSSMCKKGVPLFEAIDTIVKKEIMKELGMDVMGKEEKEILYDILKLKNFEIPCAICYVEQARQREGVVIDAFLNGKAATDKKGADVKLGWNQVLDSIQREMKSNGVDYTFNFVSREIATDKYIPAESNMDEQTYAAFAEAVKKIANEEITRYNNAKGKKRPLLKEVTPEAVNECFKGALPSNLKIFKILLTEPSSRFKIQNDLLYSSMTTKNLTMAHNGLYSLFNSQGGVSGYKTKQAPTVYWGEILNKKWKPEDTRKEGGVRNQSNSDFQMYTLLDQAQMYMDFSAKGYYLQAYTKVLSELKLFGLSRGKINASLIPQVKLYRNSDGTVDVEKTMENAGLDENGNPIYDDIEGINHNEAFMLLEDPEYSKNIGGICIGYSDNHIRKLLDDNRVQLIIGFHDKTNDPNKRYRGARYAKNYNGLNEATKLKADGTSETVHIGFNPFVKKAEKKFQYNKDTETFEGTVTYKGKTYTADDIPRLATDLYLEHCAKKGLAPAYDEFHTHPNYYKLLADFSLYDSEGHYAPHQKVAYNMPDSVPYLDADGNKQYMSSEEYIKIELQKELAVRDSLIDALADDSEDGIIPRFKAEVEKRKIAPTQYSMTKEESEHGDEAVAFEPSQIKSAAPITRDEDGNVIPLSKRFDSSNDDIRYSISKDGENTSGDWHISGKDFGDQDEFAEFAPIREDVAKNATTTTVSNMENVAPTTENSSVTEAPADEDTPIDSHALDKELEKLTEKFDQRRAELEGILKDRNAYLSRRASELYDEIRNLKKGVRASDSLGALLDLGYDWNSIRSALVNIKYTPGERVNMNSPVESFARQMLNEEFEDLEYEYSELDSEYEKQADEVKKQIREQEAEEWKLYNTRQGLHQRLVEGIDAEFAAHGYDFDEVLRNAKNLSTFQTVDNTPQRVMEKALGYKEGGILADMTVNKVAQNETEKIKWLNSFLDRKNGLLAHISKQHHIKPGSNESAAAQMYAEGFYVNEKNEIIGYGDYELSLDFPNAKVRERIKGLARDPRIRQIYDETLNAINESRKRNLYPEIPRLDNYFLHFRAQADTYSRLGLPFNPNDIRAKDLPTDLNGVTADLKPGQPYFASAMHRTGKRTSFDLLGGLEKYLTSAANQIYHIDDIQTLRALRNYIADAYGQANGLADLDSLTEEEAQSRIEQVFNSHLSTFAKFLNEEANVLAGKTALIDRGIEGVFGRRAMTFLDTLNKQVGSNMIGYSMSSPLTNFDAIPRAFVKSNKADFVKAFGQMALNMVTRRNDGFAENSPVIIRRKGADRFHRTLWQKMSDPGYALMGAVDEISTELIARAKYNELTRKGMDLQKAHFETDKWVSKLMGDRSLGQQPQIFNSKMLGLFTKFQLEVRNNLDSMFYDSIQEAKVSNEEIQNNLTRNAKTAAKATSTIAGLAIAQHLFGQLFEEVAGYNPSFDIIEAIMKAFGYDDEEDSEDTILDNIEEAFLSLLEDMPYASTFLDGGRIPISSALPIEQFIKGVDQYGNEKSRWETVAEVAPYYLMPAGYGQIKKTAKGLNMFSDEHPISGSYTDSGGLRFPVEDTVGNRVQAALFGQYSSQNARDYFDNGRSALTEKQIAEYMELDAPIQDYWDYRDGLKDFSKQADKLKYINGLNLTKAQKDVLKSYLFDEEGYKKENPEKYAFFEKEGIGYLGYKQADSDTQEAWSWAYSHQDEYQFYKQNGVMPEDYRVYRVPMLDFKDESDTAVQWAFDNPEKATFGKVFGEGVREYRQYATDLSAIRADKDSNGKTINGSAKRKKLDYINSLDIDYGMKLILFKNEYNADDTYNVEIIEYLNSRDDISFEETVSILRQLGFTVTDDGKITWD